jgi:tRNA A-37 threonylcarbamoyl transferase component Bud32
VRASDLATHRQSEEELRLPARFQHLGPLGRGGYGRVELVHDRLRRENVALKFLDRRGSRSRADLKREFRVLSDVVHPNLVAMLELVLTDELECIALEHVDGVDLLTVLRGGASLDLPSGTVTATSSLDAQPPSSGLRRVGVQASNERIAVLFAQIVDALEALEAHDVVHGDLKPANVLVERAGEDAIGRVVVLDFGIARLRGTSGRPVGTPPYMAPEQFEVDGMLTPATDRYALGVLLHEALTGELPFVGLPAQIMFAKLDGPPRPAEGPLGALAAALMAPDPSVRPSLVQVREALRSASPSIRVAELGASPARALGTSGFVVGRTRELKRLESACDAPSPPLVVVRGAPGLGKTTLVEQLARKRPRTIVRSRCYASETIRWNAVDALVDAMSDGETLVDPSTDRAALAVLFPSLRTEETPSALEVLPVAELVRRAARGLAAMLAARGASIVLVDDAQWADDDSVTFLIDLAELAPEIAIVLTAREDDPRTHALLARLAKGRRAIESIVLTPLADEDAALLVRRAIGGDVDVASLVAMTRGVPFLVEEVALALAHAERPSLEDVRARVEARVSGLPPLERRVLELLAVHGGPLDAAILAEVIGEPQRVALRGLATARLTRIEREDATTIERIDVYHDTIRQRVLITLARDERRGAHVALAEALIAHDAAPGDVAHHLLALEDPRARAFVARAARAAEDVRALEQATAWLRRLVALTPEPAERAATRLRLASLLRRVERHVESAVELEHLAAEQDTRDSVETRRQAAEQWLAAGELERGASILRALADEGVLEEAELIRHTSLDLVVQRLKARALEPHLARTLVRSLRGARPLERIDLAWTIAGGFMLVDPTRASAIASRFLAWSRVADDPERLVRALCGEAVYQGMFGRFGQAQTDRLLEEADSLAARVDDHARAVVRGTRAVVQIQRGEIASGITALMPSVEALALHHKTIGFELMSMRHFYTYGLYYLGRFDELLTHVESEYDEARQRGNRHRESDVCLNHATLAWLLRGGPELARERARDAAAFWASVGPSVQRYYAVVSEALTALWEGHEDALDATTAAALSRDVLHPVIALAEGMRADFVHTLGRLHVARAALRPTRERLAVAAAWSSLLAADPAVHARPLAMLQLAGVAAAAGHGARADALAARAAVGLEALGLSGYARVARSVRGGRVDAASLPPALVRVLAPGLAR